MSPNQKTAKTAKRQGKAIKVMRKKKINKSEIYFIYLLVCKPSYGKRIGIWGPSYSPGEKKKKKRRQAKDGT